MEASSSVTTENALCPPNKWKDRIHCLFEENLITEEERNTISKSGNKSGSKLFNLLMKKDSKSSHKILKILKNDPTGLEDKEDPEQDSKEDFKLVPATNPMDIAPIIKNVFRFLSLEDIKNCRYVCQEWNEAAKPMLRKRCQISFGHPANISRFTRTVAQFQKDFRKTQANMPFTAMRLKYIEEHNNAPWTLPALRELFHSWGSNLKELKINSFKIQNVFNIIRAGQPFNITNMLTEPSLTRLNIDIGSGPHRRLELSLDKLLHIKYLRIVECNLIIEKECITPIEVEIIHSNILFSREDSLNVLNHFINFRLMRKLVYHNCMKEVGLDFRGKYHLDSVNLSNIIPLNWESSNWNIDKLTLSDWLGRTTMRIRSIVVSESMDSLYGIPESVEQLNFSAIRICRERLSLPNLQHLVFRSIDENLKCFENCPNLTSMEMKMTFNTPRKEVLASNIPPNIQKLLISGAFKLNGTWPRPPLESLVLDCPITNMKALVNKFNPEEVVVILQNTGAKNTNLLKFLLTTDKPIWIGKFNWDNINFGICRIAPLVDKKSDYYIFNHKRGEAIDRKEFRTKIPFW